MKSAKKPLVFLLILLVFINIFSSNIVFGATNSEINLIFKELKNDPILLPKLYQAGVNYSSQGVTNQFIDNSLMAFIGNSLDDIRAAYSSGDLNENNFKDKLADIIVKRAYSLDVFMLAIISDAFPDDIQTVLSKKVPISFKALYDVLETKTKIIIGLIPNPNPTEKPSSNVSNLQPIPVVNDNTVCAFLDMEDYKWAKDAVVALSTLGIINGFSDTIFSPSENVTREQFAKMLAVAIKINIETPKAKFSDVKEDDWFYSYVCSMADLGYIKGIDENLFGSGYNITRQDMAVLMFRIGESLNAFSQTEELQKFQDEKDISDYAVNSVNTLKAIGIVNGTPENNFNPKSFATRAEAAQMLYNFYKYITVEK
jgi:hypothetical protein